MRDPAAATRCTATTHHDSGIVRCDRDEHDETIGHVYEFGDGMAVGWGGPNALLLASLKPGMAAIVEDGVLVKVEVVPDV